MKTLVFFIAIALFSGLHAQTDSIERVSLKKANELRKISKADYSFILRKWEEKLKSNTYPEVSLNNSGKVQYSYFLDFQDLSKEMLFDRILEWLAIRYGMIPAYLYSNAANGKIIYTNFEKVQPRVQITFSCVVTVKDGKILIDFENIGYENTSGGYYSGETFIPERTDFSPIDNVFPVITKELDTWDFYFTVLKKMDTRFKSDMEGLNDFIGNYDQKYNY